jgi:2-polyprenyl-6-methoxyphenol hydroxylase-like FAD-dependent oxidoreductase
MHVVIVGAGIIGSTLAASLADTGQKVTLIDAPGTAPARPVSRG